MITIKIRKRNGTIEEKEALVAYEWRRRTYVVVRSSDDELFSDVFILKKGLFKKTAHEKLVGFEEDYVQRLKEKENGELFFLGDSEAEKIDLDIVEKRFGNIVFNYEFNPLIKSTKRLFS